MKQNFFSFCASLGASLILGNFILPGPLSAQNTPKVPVLSIPESSPNVSSPISAHTARNQAKANLEEVEIDEVEIDEGTVRGKSTVTGPKSSNSKNPKKSSQTAEANFRKGLEAYQKAGKKIRELQKNFMALNTTEEEKEALGEDLQKYAEYISKLYPKLLDLAEA
ncbi:MAG: hypothetical protein E7028_04895, partial [Planctomycetaceae bacterium]|nr:hypothetical protein [Planctomycetaceae bacterium]